MRPPPPLMPELGEDREDAAGSLNSVYRPSWILLPACNLFFWVYPRVVSMSMPNYFSDRKNPLTKFTVRHDT